MGHSGYPQWSIVRRSSTHCFPNEAKLGLNYKSVQETSFSPLLLGLSGASERVSEQFAPRIYPDPNIEVIGSF